MALRTPCRWLTLAALTALPWAAAAADGTLTLKVENDFLASSDDGHYTSGVELNWAFQPDAEHWSQRVACGSAL